VGRVDKQFVDECGEAAIFQAEVIGEEDIAGWGAVRQLHQQQAAQRGCVEYGGEQVLFLFSRVRVVEVGIEGLDELQQGGQVGGGCSPEDRGGVHGRWIGWSGR
jgi:hypothetical protein